MMKRKHIALVVALIILLPTAVKAQPLQLQTVEADGTVYEVVEKLGEITISAYYPGEDGYWVNHKGESLTELVGENVAVPTGHRLLGEYIYIEGVGIRRCWNTGCKPGRIDLLVADAGEMNEWGLRDVNVWVLEDKGNKNKGE